MLKQRRNLGTVSFDDEERLDGKGKRHHQKIMPYVVLQYLMKYSGEEHVISAEQICRNV